MLYLVFVAIVFGNTAYEAGNLSGVYIGLLIIDFKDFIFQIFGLIVNYAVIFIILNAFLPCILNCLNILKKR